MPPPPPPPPPPKKQPKPVFRTDLPFAQTKWPQVSSKDHDIILDLLCNLLEPIGHYRRTHIHPSRGKKRKRASKAGQDAISDDDDAPPPPVPEINSHILVGINSVTRHLSQSAARSAPRCMPAAEQEKKTQKRPELLEPAGPAGVQSEESNRGEPAQGSRPLSVVVIPHPSPSTSLAHAHLPALIYLSSLPSRSPGETLPASPDPTRLVTLSTSSETRLASALHLPRVGVLGLLQDAPGADALSAYVRENVERVECKWIEQALKPEWTGVKIASS